MPDVDAIKRNPATLGVYRSRLRLKLESGEWVGLCPLHSEKSGSFHVSLKDGVWLWTCFGSSTCGSGNVFQLVQKMDGIGFKEAVAKVEAFLGVESTFKPLGAEDTVKKTFSLTDFAKLEANLANSTPAREYLKSRGITLETAKKFHLGLHPKNGLAIPCIENGQVVSVKYRGISEKTFTRQPNMATTIFNLETVSPLEPVFVTEGELDAITLEQAGFKAVAIPSATYHLTPEQKLAILDADCVILAGDTDSSGSEAMQRLWKDFGDRTFLLTWPAGHKDANETAVATGAKFPGLVAELAVQAKSVPMPGIYSLQESMVSSNRTNMSDHPGRLRFPWPSVDKMAILLPGSVMTITATNSKMGKTAFVKDLTMHAALVGETILNYSCELSTDEYATLVTAGVLKKNRNHLDKDDYKEAARLISNIRYFIGRNPTLTTVGPVLDLIEAAVIKLKPTVVVLDHFHFICRNETNEIQSQGNAFQRIKNMAVRYDLKFIVVAQPRKAKQETKGKMIHMTDLKGAEVVCSDADAIFVLHRETIKIKDPENPPQDDYDPKTEVHLLGARHKGDGGTYSELQFFGQYATFREMTDRPETGQAQKEF